MKKEWRTEIPQGMYELSVEDTRSIVGGESLMFWIGYAVGKIAHAIAG